MAKELVSATPMLKAALGVMDAEDRIETCQPVCRMRFGLLMFGLGLLGYGRARVSSTRRSLDEQSRLYGRGRTAAELRVAGVDPGYAAPGLSRVTWTEPMKSKHVGDRAMDVWFGGYARVEWFRVGALAALLGLTWGGDWSKKDYGHFEV